MILVTFMAIYLKMIATVCCRKMISMIWIFGNFDDDLKLFENYRLSSEDAGCLKQVSLHCPEPGRYFYISIFDTRYCIFGMSIIHI